MEEQDSEIQNMVQGAELWGPQEPRVGTSESAAGNLRMTVNSCSWVFKEQGACRDSPGIAGKFSESLLCAPIHQT